MTDRQTNHFKRMILVSAPWPIFSRPSIQLGALKAYLHKQFPDIEIINDHFYLLSTFAAENRFFPTLSVEGIPGMLVASASGEEKFFRLCVL